MLSARECELNFTAHPTNSLSKSTQSSRRKHHTFRLDRNTSVVVEVIIWSVVTQPNDFLSEMIRGKCPFGRFGSKNFIFFLSHHEVPPDWRWRLNRCRCSGRSKCGIGTTDSISRSAISVVVRGLNEESTGDKTDKIKLLSSNMFLGGFGLHRLATWITFSKHARVCPSKSLLVDTERSKSSIVFDSQWSSERRKHNIFFDTMSWVVTPQQCSQPFPTRMQVNNHM